MQQVGASVNKKYEDYCSFVEKESRLVEFGLYGLTGTLLAFAVWKRRPISRFTRASDIPDHFIKEKVLQAGVVKKIQPSSNGPVLLVNHKPPLGISLSSKLLPVRVASVNIDGNGFSWLQMIMTDQEIKFVPFNNSGDELHARVYLLEENKNNKNKPPLDVGRALVGLGFAKTVPLVKEIDMKSNLIETYNRQLKGTEARAKFNRRGQWNGLPENWVKFKLRKQWEKILFNLKPLDRKIPAIVR